jgi:peptide/nickel transport system permease protein
MRSSKVSFYLLLFVCIIVLNFMLPRLMPGGPIAYLQGGGDDSMMLVMTQEQKEKLLTYYNLDQPLHRQFIDFVAGIFRGDLGMSIHFKTSVTEIIFAHAKWTFLLVGISILITVLIGIFLGVAAAWMQGSRRDYAIFTSLLAVGAIPEFVIATLLLLFFSIQWQWFPLSGSATPFAEYGGGVTGTIRYFGDLLHHAVLPVLTLTLANIPSIYLLIRASTLTVLREPYLFAAEAKGLSRMRLLFRHTLRNALLPVITLITLRIAFLFTGAVLVETVFSYPGMGKLMYTAIIARDYPLMHGLFLVFTTAILMMNLLTELLYPLLDPRIRRKEIKDYA